MKDIRYHISLYVIIPIIFAGYATLSSILTYQLVQYCLKQNLSADLPVFWLIILVIIFGALCGLAIVWIILKPFKEFLRDTKTVLPEVNEDDIKSERQIKNVFKHVTNALSRVDARQMFPNVIAEAEVMRGVLDQVNRVAPTDSTVLVLGENGTGKELIVTCIQEHSKRKDGPFIKMNCVAIPDTLWESELFGHEPGAFTGATKRKIGKFELANHGTIFLDEIGDMPLDTQAKMLRVLQEREFERVGGSKTIKLDIRIIAATNKNLEKMVAEKTFKEDLFFRLNVFTLHLPPLRERREDIPHLIEHFCKQSKVAITPLATQMLRDNHNWPGNVRELQNIVERARVMCENDVIEPQHLPINIIGDGVVMPSSLSISEKLQPEDEENFVERNLNLSIDDQLKEIEQAMIIEALKKTNGVQVQAAKLLKIKERALWHRIKKFEIDAKQFKEKKS